MTGSPKKNQILFVADPPEALSPKGDTSLALAEAALAQGFEVHWTTPQGIAIDGFSVHSECLAELLEVELDEGHLPRWRTDPAQLPPPQPLTNYHSVFIRKDPPFDQSYMGFCWMLALDSKARILNPPSQLLKYHEKTLHFAALSHGVLKEDEVIPAVVSKNSETVRQAIKKWEGAGHREGYIIKPWLGYGGRGVLFAPDCAHALEYWVAESQNALQMVQPFDPKVKETGDVRVIIAGGEIIGSFARIPAPGRVASNLAQGGSAHGHVLSPKQREIMVRVAKFLTQEGISFAGLDLIGDRINEINITSPTGLRSLQKLGQKDAPMRTLKAIFQ